MSISNELSGEIVAAVLTAKERSPEELQKLKKMLIEVHATLQQMADYKRKIIGNPRTNPNKEPGESLLQN